MARARYRFGTSSWSEPSWVGVFYPPGTRPAEFLREYARRYDTVEADVTYYRIPSEAMVRGWEAKTPEGFVFSAKLPRSIVHAGEGPRPDGERALRPEAVGADLERFLARMRLLGPKLGPLLVQLPYFNKSAFSGLDAFLARLEAFLALLPADLAFALEVRNKTWIGEELLGLLRARGIALCLVDLHYMPHPAELAQRLDLLTADFLYARLIGDRKKVESLTRTFDRIVVDQRPRLERWAALLRELGPRVRESYAYANNHYAGHGPATVDALAALVRGERPPPAPTAPGELPF